MKRIICILILILIASVSVYSQETKMRSNAFLINPFLPVVNLYQNVLFSIFDPYMYYFYFAFDYQRMVSNSLSITISPLFGTVQINDITKYTDLAGNVLYQEDYYWTETEYTISIGVEYRPQKTGLKGVYIGAYPSIGFLHVNDDYYENVYTQIGFFALSGYQWLFNNGFTLKLGGGIGYDWYLPSPKNNGNQYEAEYAFNLPFSLTMDLSLGYSF